MACNCGCSNPCTCGSRVPFYDSCEGDVQETHCQSVILQQFATAISNSSDFVMPICGGTAIVNFPNVTQLQVGSYLWSSAVGYLRILEFDSLNQAVKLINDCIIGSVAPGAVIPRCTLFNVVDSPMGVGLASSNLAAIGTNLATAATLITPTTFVSGANGVKGVKLPLSPNSGDTYYVVNTENGILFLYPGQGTDQINALGAGVAISLNPYVSAICKAYNATQWWVGRLS